MTNPKRSHQPTLENQDRRAGEIDAVAKRQAGDIEIPANEWPAFLDSFSRQHEGWLASLSVEQGSKISLFASMCSVQKIAMDGAQEKRSVNISVVEGGKERIHSVPEPSRLTFKRDSAGAHEGLEIASKDGSVTILRFRAAARPETLDGVAPNVNRPS